MIQEQKLPRVSVILPLSGSADGFTVSLESVRCQTFTDFELIVVDDRSAIPALDMQAGVADSRIVVIRHPEPYGTARACNTGISAARGELVGFIRCGDTWDIRKLEEQVASLSHLSPEYGVVYSDVREVTPAGNHAYRHAPDMDGPELLNEYGTDFLAAALGTGSVLMRRSFLEKAGPFDEQCRSFFETDIIIRLQKICRFHHIRKPLCHCRSLPALPSSPFEESIARLLLLQKYPEALHNPLFVAQQAEMIRRSLWQAREGTPSAPVHETNEMEHGYHLHPVPDL